MSIDKIRSLSTQITSRDQKIENILKVVYPNVNFKLVVKKDGKDREVKNKTLNKLTDNLWKDVIKNLDNGDRVLLTYDELTLDWLFNFLTPQLRDGIFLPAFKSYFNKIYGSYDKIELSTMSLDQAINVMKFDVSRYNVRYDRNLIEFIFIQLKKWIDKKLPLQRDSHFNVVILLLYVIMKGEYNANPTLKLIVDLGYSPDRANLFNTWAKDAMISVLMRGAAIADLSQFHKIDRIIEFLYKYEQTSMNRSAIYRDDNLWTTLLIEIDRNPSDGTKYYTIPTFSDEFKTMRVLYTLYPEMFRRALVGFYDFYLNTSKSKNLEKTNPPKTNPTDKDIDNELTLIAETFKVAKEEVEQRARFVNEYVLDNLLANWDKLISYDAYISKNALIFLSLVLYSNSPPFVDTKTKIKPDWSTIVFKVIDKNDPRELLIAREMRDEIIKDWKDVKKPSLFNMEKYKLNQERNDNKRRAEEVERIRIEKVEEERKRKEREAQRKKEADERRAKEDEELRVKKVKLQQEEREREKRQQQQKDEEAEAIRRQMEQERRKEEMKRENMMQTEKLHLKLTTGSSNVFYSNLAIEDNGVISTFSFVVEGRNIKVTDKNKKVINIEIEHDVIETFYKLYYKENIYLFINESTIVEFPMNLSTNGRVVNNKEEFLKNWKFVNVDHINVQLEGSTICKYSQVKLNQVMVNNSPEYEIEVFTIPSLLKMINYDPNQLTKKDLKKLEDLRDILKFSRTKENLRKVQEYNLKAEKGSEIKLDDRGFIITSKANMIIIRRYNESRSNEDKIDYSIYSEEQLKNAEKGPGEDRDKLIQGISKTDAIAEATKGVLINVYDAIQPIDYQNVQSQVFYTSTHLLTIILMFSEDANDLSKRTVCFIQAKIEQIQNKDKTLVTAMKRCMKYVFKTPSFDDIAQFKVIMLNFKTFFIEYRFHSLPDVYYTPFLSLRDNPTEIKEYGNLEVGVDDLITITPNNETSKFTNLFRRFTTNKYYLLYNTTSNYNTKLSFIFYRWEPVHSSGKFIFVRVNYENLVYYGQASVPNLAPNMIKSICAPFSSTNNILLIINTTKPNLVYTISKETNTLKQDNNYDIRSACLECGCEAKMREEYNEKRIYCNDICQWFHHHYSSSL